MGKAPLRVQRASSAPSSTLARKGSGPKAKPKRSRCGRKSKSSNFIGVTKNGEKWQARIWERECGRFLHLGTFASPEDAARAYDRAVLHFCGRDADTNYPVEQYEQDPLVNALPKLSKEEFVLRLREAKAEAKAPIDKPKGTIGVTKYRGKWQARICRRDLHIGTFAFPEDAARAYDRAVLHLCGRDADTNYPVDQYEHDPLVNAIPKLSEKDFVLRLREAKAEAKAPIDKPKGTIGVSKNGEKWQARCRRDLHI